MEKNMTAATAAQNGKKTMRVGDIVNAYNVLKTLKIAKLPREDQFAVLRASRALKPVATAFDDFVNDARERLKPEDFDSIVEKSQRFDSLPEEEKVRVNMAARAYQNDVDECVREEYEKAVDVDAFDSLSEEAISGIATGNDTLDVQTLLLLESL